MWFGDNLAVRLTLLTYSGILFFSMTQTTQHEKNTPLGVILHLPQAMREAKQLFFTRHKVAPSVVGTESADESAFAVPKGIDPSTPDGQKALKHLQRARVRRAGFRQVKGIHIEPGSLASLLGDTSTTQTPAERPAKPPFLKDHVRRRVKAADSDNRNVASTRRLIRETAELDDLFRHTDHTVSMDERQAKARQKLEELDKKQGAKVTWDESGTTNPSESVDVKWE